MEIELAHERLVAAAAGRVEAESAEVQPAIADLVTSSNTAITQMGQLVNANNHTTEAVRSFSIVGINVDRKR